jgi:hypothetical protein
MDAVFQMANVRNDRPNTFLPLCFRSELSIPSMANSKGRNANHKTGPVYGMGGQASQSKKAVNSAK